MDHRFELVFADRALVFGRAVGRVGPDRSGDILSIDKRTMREFNEAWLAPAPVLSPDAIKAIREAERFSQTVFARYLNVSKNLVSDRGRGAKKPGGPAMRLLSIIQRNGLDAVA